MIQERSISLAIDLKDDRRDWHAGGTLQRKGWGKHPQMLNDIGRNVINQSRMGRQKIGIVLDCGSVVHYIRAILAVLWFFGGSLMPCLF